MVEPVPLKAMGRFEHETAPVDPRTGIVYMTEDNGDPGDGFYGSTAGLSGRCTVLRSRITAETFVHGQRMKARHIAQHPGGIWVAGRQIDPDEPVPVRDRGR